MPVKPTDEAKSWRVWARLTGPDLPLTDVTIGRALVGPGPKGYRPTGPPTSPVLNWNSDLTYFAASAPTMRVVSDCWVVISDVVATSSDKAIDQVASDDVPYIVAALSAGGTKNPYRVQLWGADDGSTGESPSGVVKTAAFPKDALAPERLEEVRQILEAIKSDSKLSVAAEVFYRGVQYGDYAAGSPTAASAVLAFYQVLEACAATVESVPPDDFEAQREAIAGSLRTALNKKSTAKKQAAAIRAANDALNRLDLKYASLRIENAASVFGLDSDWIDRSRDLGKFRNTKLGHPNSLPALSEFGKWERDTGDKMGAYGLASTMLRAAIAHAFLG